MDALVVLLIVRARSAWPVAQVQRDCDRSSDELHFGSLRASGIATFSYLCTCGRQLDRSFSPGQKRTDTTKCPCGRRARYDVTATFRSTVNVIPDRPEQYCESVGRGFRSRRDFREYLKKSQDSDRPLCEYERVTPRSGGRHGDTRPQSGNALAPILNRESMSESQQRDLAARITREYVR